MRGRPRGRARVSTALLAVSLLLACAPSPPEAPAAAAPSEYGGRFVFPVRIEPATMNFVIASDQISDMVARLVGDGLVDRDVDLNVVPRLAESWSFSDGGRTLTFHLRPGVRFHDGHPLTSEDVKYTYERVIDPKSHALGRLDGFLPIERVETPDATTVRVVYRYAYSPALSAWEMPILPKHLYERGDFLTSPLNRAPVGSGPFRFVSWEPGRRILLAANIDYWGGRPYLDTLELSIIPSQETTLQALLAGEVDYAPLTAIQWQAHARDPDFGRRFATVEYLSLFFYYIAWRSDGSNPFFSDPDVRRAMTLALDREGYVRTVLRGFGKVSDSIFHPAVLRADPDIAPLRYDPKAAASLLDRAGWRLDPTSGLRRKNGTPFRFTLIIYAGGEDHVQFSQVAQESLRRLGIEMTIQRLDWPGLSARLRKGDFQAAMSGAIPGVDPDDELYPMLHSSQVRGGRNYAGFRDAQIDAWLEEGRRSVDSPERTACYRRIERRLLDLQPYTYLFFPTIRAALSRRIAETRPSPRGILTQYPGVLRIKMSPQGGG
ncbi:MAG TPA: ABC transporter substrate-binding protein [Candidatus Polarisedimenticolia bacterium]|nr:ABC transporter substrate-binding protein [Candidatus Polarisedimenticolia bacterium]